MGPTTGRTVSTAGRQRALRVRRGGTQARGLSLQPLPPILSSISSSASSAPPLPRPGPGKAGLPAQCSRGRDQTSWQPAASSVLPHRVHNRQAPDFGRNPAFIRESQADELGSSRAWKAPGCVHSLCSHDPPKTLQSLPQRTWQVVPAGLRAGSRRVQPSLLGADKGETSPLFSPSAHTALSNPMAPGRVLSRHIQCQEQDGGCDGSLLCLFL